MIHLLEVVDLVETHSEEIHLVQRQEDSMIHLLEAVDLVETHSEEIHSVQRQEDSMIHSLEAVDLAETHSEVVDLTIHLEELVQQIHSEPPQPQETHSVVVDLTIHWLMEGLLIRPSVR